MHVFPRRLSLAELEICKPWIYQLVIDSWCEQHRFKYFYSRLATLRKKQQASRHAQFVKYLLEKSENWELYSWKFSQIMLTFSYLFLHETCSNTTIELSKISLHNTAFFLNKEHGHTVSYFSLCFAAVASLKHLKYKIIKYNNEHVFNIQYIIKDSYLFFNKTSKIHFLK